MIANHVVHPAWEEIDAVYLLTPGTNDPGNSAPSAVGDSATVDEDDSVEIDVRDNDSDSDGNEFLITEISEPSNGYAWLDTKGTYNDTSDDVIVYEPEADFFGCDEFTYTIRDIYALRARRRCR